MNGSKACTMNPAGFGMLCRFADPILVGEQRWWENPWSVNKVAPSTWRDKSQASCSSPTKVMLLWLEAERSPWWCVSLVNKNAGCWILILIFSAWLSLPIKEKLLLIWIPFVVAIIYILICTSINLLFVGKGFGFNGARSKVVQKLGLVDLASAADPFVP